MAAWRPDVAGQLAAAGANALVAGSAVFKGGTLEAYKTNISAIRTRRRWRAAKRSDADCPSLARRTIADAGATNLAWMNSDPRYFPLAYGGY